MAIAARLASSDKTLHDKVQASTAKLLASLGTKHNPPYIASVLFRNAYKLLKTSDPYLGLKNEYNHRVKKLFPALEKIIEKSTNRLSMAVKMALAGNIIDFGILENFDLDLTLKETLDLPIPLTKITEIRKRIVNSGTILYIADNAGEIGFDAFLLREMGRINPGARIYLSVKSSPIINDATERDARFFNLQKLARIIESGGNWIGTHPRLCSNAFQKVFYSADLIVSKGQANYESLEELRIRRILFLLKAKCPVVASNLKVKLNNIVIKLK